MRRRSRRFARRIGGKKRELIWVRALMDFGTIQATPGGLSDQVTVVDRNDWARSAAANVIEKGCTLVRAIGDYTVRFVPNEAPGAAVASNVFAFGLLKRDEDDNTTLDLASDFFQEDWLHVTGGALDLTVESVATLTWADANWRAQVRHFDTKVKRKLTSEDAIQLVAATAGDNAVQVAGLFQFLLMLP